MEFFTWQYLATIAGATAATVLISNGLAMAFGLKAKWLALAVAFVVQLVVWFFTAPTADALVLALINTFVVYLAAGGANQVIHAARIKTDKLELAANVGGEYRSFWQPWW